MGFFVDGHALVWDDLKPFIPRIKFAAFQQFCHLFNDTRLKEGHDLLFGDEIEYLTVYNKDKKSRLSLLAEAHYPAVDTTNLHLAYEFGCHMFEATPAGPYGTSLASLLDVQTNSLLRREEINKVLPDGHKVLTIPVYPLMGVGDFTEPSTKPHDPVFRSCYSSDDVMNSNPRFSALARNIRLRRTGKVSVTAPVYVDEYTQDTHFLTVPQDPENPLTEAMEELPISERSFTNRTYFRTEYPLGKVSSCCCTGSPICECKHEKWPHSCPQKVNPNCCAPEVMKKPLGLLHVTPTISKKIYEPFHQPLVRADAMVFGMGNTGLQCTFQAKNISQARVVYDFLVPIVPVLSTLGGNTAAFRGIITDINNRYNLIAQSVDDRSPSDLYYQAQSRYGVTPSYIAESGMQYNDTLITIDKACYAWALKAGFDEALAAHLANIFSRDPLVVYDTEIDHIVPSAEEVAESISRVGSQDSLSAGYVSPAGAGTPPSYQDIESGLFEGLQSTSWYSLRFKPPPPGRSSIGWRVEFRPLDTQTTDFESAAFVVFINLLVKAMLTFQLTSYVPMSLVHDAFSECGKLDAVENTRYPWNLRQVEAPSLYSETTEATEALKDLRKWFLKHAENRLGNETELLSVDQIINGDEKHIGLVEVVRLYLAVCLRTSKCSKCWESIEEAHVIPEDIIVGLTKHDGSVLSWSQLYSSGICEHGLKRLLSYCTLMSKRASGELPLGAEFQRNFYLNHPDYKRDSVVTETMAADFIDLIIKGNDGDYELFRPLLGDLVENCPAFVNPN